MKQKIIVWGKGMALLLIWLCLSVLLPAFILLYIACMVGEWYISLYSRFIADMKASFELFDNVLENKTK